VEQSRSPMDKNRKTRPARPDERDPLTLQPSLPWQEKAMP
jgi:hypothetical protein